VLVRDVEAELKPANSGASTHGLALTRDIRFSIALGQSHVEAPGGAKACIKHISSTRSYSRDEVKKFAASLSAVAS